MNATINTNPTKFVYFGWSSVSALARTGYGKTRTGAWYKVSDRGRCTVQAAKAVPESKVPGKHLMAADEIISW